MSKLQFLKVVILALVCSSLPAYRIIARPSSSLSENQLISQTPSTAASETFTGEITAIDNDLVKVQTPEGLIKDVKISETEQQQLGLQLGSIVSVTVNTTASGEEIPEKVMLEEQPELAADATDIASETNTVAPTNAQETTEVSAEPVPALW